MAKSFAVDDRSPAVEAMAAEWPMIDALLAGTSAMRAGGKTYLPQWPKETDESYKARLATATLFPAFKRTAAVLAAKPFAREIQVDPETVDSSVSGLLDDVDLQGTNLQPFAADLFLQVMQRGLCGVLVDTPPAQGVRTRAQERAAGVRPYMTVYPAGTILGWKAERRKEGAVLTQLRLLEEYSEPDGEWGEETDNQVRVLTPGHWQVWRKKKGGPKEDWALFEEGDTSIDVIPFVFFYGVKKGFGIGAPPLLELAYLNVEHWQSASDQQTIMHVARVPILFAAGFQDGDNITIGSASATVSSDPNAKLSYVEHTGAAISAGRQSLLDLEDRMRQIGAELLVQQPATVTATAVRSDDEGNRSILQKIVEDFEESLAACLNLMGKWLSKDSKAKIELYKDFGSANLGEKAGDLLLRGQDSGAVSRQTTFEQLQRMDAVDPKLSWEDEKARLAEDAKAEAAKAAASPPAVQTDPGAQAA